jgi:hypothetical protein
MERHEPQPVGCQISSADGPVLVGQLAEATGLAGVRCWEVAPQHPAAGLRSTHPQPLRQVDHKTAAPLG